jgi:hypothetical protein
MILPITADKLEKLKQGILAAHTPDPDPSAEATAKVAGTVGSLAAAHGSADGFLKLLAGVVEAERLVVAGLSAEMPCRKMHENRHRAFREALSMATAYFQPNAKPRNAPQSE